MSPDDCLFCKLVQEGDHVAKADGFVAIHDINPQADTHLLVLPKRHIDTFREIGEFPADEAKRNRERAELLFQLLDEIDWDENPTIRPGVLNGGTFGISRSSRVTRESLVEYLAEELAGQRAAFEHDSPYDESDPQTCEQVARDREMLAALDAILQRLESGEIGAPRVHDTADDRAAA